MPRFGSVFHCSSVQPALESAVRTVQSQSWIRLADDSISTTVPLNGVAGTSFSGQMSRPSITQRDPERTTRFLRRGVSPGAGRITTSAALFPFTAGDP